MQHTLHYVRLHMITASRRASLSMLAHRTRILSSLHAHQLASPSAPDGPPSLHVQMAEDDVTSGRAARCSASACSRDMDMLLNDCALRCARAARAQRCVAVCACAREAMIRSVRFSLFSVSMFLILL